MIVYEETGEYEKVEVGDLSAGSTFVYKGRPMLVVLEDDEDEELLYVRLDDGLSINIKSKEQIRVVDFVLQPRKE